MSILLAAALLPPFYLLWKVYKIDSIEREPIGLLAKVFVLGMVSTIPASIMEGIGGGILESIFGTASGTVFNIFMYFIVVAGSEEIVKYFSMKIPTWNNREFNYVFDGVVYSAAASLGFAAFENVLYVMGGGLLTAGVRAVTSIPVHCICGIYMGHYYGVAKSAEVAGHNEIVRRMKRKALLVPMLIHGFYDFVLSENNDLLILAFIIYVIAVYYFAIKDLNKYSKQDLRMF